MKSMKNTQRYHWTPKRLAPKRFPGPLNAVRNSLARRNLSSHWRDSCTQEAARG